MAVDTNVFVGACMGLRLARLCDELTNQALAEFNAEPHFFARAENSDPAS